MKWTSCKMLPSLEIIIDTIVCWPNWTIWSEQTRLHGVSAALELQLRCLCRNVVSCSYDPEQPRAPLPSPRLSAADRAKPRFLWICVVYATPASRFVGPISVEYLLLLLPLVNSAGVNYVAVPALYKLYSICTPQRPQKCHYIFI